MRMTETLLLERRYVGRPGAQVHMCSTLDAPAATNLLYCLHATAYSGQTFRPLMQTMAGHRGVIAVDTPGYGGSDPPPAVLEISEYAARIADVIEADSSGRCVDILGYHTGAVIAAELARQRPNLVRRIVLIGIPYFIGKDRELWRRRLAVRTELSEDLAQFDERWNFFITNRNPAVSLGRGFENFVDELRAWPDGWWAHEAAFKFSVEICFPAVTQPALVINANNHLSQASREAAAAMPNCRTVELAHLDHAILEAAPYLLGRIIDDFLGQSPADQGANPRELL